MRFATLQKFALSITFIIVISLGTATKAEAGFTEFILSDYAHPSQGTAGLFMQGPQFGHHFSFNNVRLRIDTTPVVPVMMGGGGSGIPTFHAEIWGDITHQESGEAWTMSGAFDNFRFQPGHPLVPGGPFNPGPVPYDGIFEDWQASGDRSAILFYDAISLSLVPGILNPTYQGPTELVGKQDPNGDTLLFNYRRFGGPPDVFGATAWFSAADDKNGGLIADIHFNAQIVPEPASFALMSLGLGAVGWYRRKKKA